MKNRRGGDRYYNGRIGGGSKKQRGGLGGRNAGNTVQSQLGKKNKKTKQKK